MSNILIISAVFPPEPVVSAKLSHDLASELSKAHNVIVLCPKPSRPFGFDFMMNRRISNSKFDIIELSSFVHPKMGLLGRLRENWSFAKATRNYIETNRAEIEIVYADTWPLISQYFVVKIAKKYNIPVVIHVQDLYPESFANKLGIFAGVFNFFLLPLDKYVVNNATAVIAISEKMKLYISSSRKLLLEKIFVVLNWQDEQPFLRYHEKNFLSEEFTFMYLGNIGPVAGVNLLIDAFILADIPNSKLIIAGSGSMKNELIKYSSRYAGIKIDFIDVPEGKVPAVQECADVLLLPIRSGAASSSIPSKLPAYMFSSKPVICCADANSDTAQCIAEANCGYVVEPDNMIELAKVMIEIAKENPSTLKLLGENGRNYALSVFSKKSNLDRLVKVINKFIKPK